MKTEAQKQARYLRSVEGRSVKEIAKLVGVSQSSASVWVRGIRLTDQQRASLVERAKLSRNRSRSAYFRSRRLAYQMEGRALARQGDAMHVAGCMLYWAEGSKSRKAVQFVNSDPAVVRCFVAFLRTQFAVPDEAFRLDCNLFADHVEHQREIEQFWLDTLGLPAPCLRESTVNVYSKYSQKSVRTGFPMEPCASACTRRESSRASTAQFRNTAASSDRSGWADQAVLTRLC
jgi:DNA-binding MarR family transcriptional regulator